MPTNSEGKYAKEFKLFETAKEYFKKKEYFKALHAMNKVIESMGADTKASLYYFRGTIHQKFGNKTQMYEDARMSVNKDKNYPGGYLLKGHYAIMRKQFEKANSFVEFVSCLLKTNTSLRDWSKEYETLACLIPDNYRGRTDLLHKKPSKPLNIIKIFPYEIIRIVFDYLTFPDVVRSTGVCKSWNVFLTRDPTFWKKILHPVSSKVKIKKYQIVNYIRRSKGKLQQLLLDNIPETKEIMQALVDNRCYQLNDLKLLSCGIGHSIRIDDVLVRLQDQRLKSGSLGSGLVTLVLIGTKYRNEELQRILQRCPNIETLILSYQGVSPDSIFEGSLCKLKRLKLVSDSVFGQPSKLIQNLSMVYQDSLESFEVHNERLLDDNYLDRFTKLTFLSYKKVCRPRATVMSVPNTLQTVKLPECVLDPNSLQSLLGQLDNVVTLNLSNTIMSNDYFVYFGRMKHLKRLELAVCAGIDDTGMLKLVTSGCPIEYLDISFSSITDNTIKMILQFMPSLTVLCVDGCVKLTGDHLLELLDKCSGMNALFCRSCPGMANSRVKLISEACKSKGISFYATLS